MSRKPHFSLRGHRLEALGVLASALVMLVAFSLWLAGDTLARQLVPLAGRILSPDGIVTAAGAARIDRVLGAVTTAALILGCGGIAYFLLLRFISPGLPTQTCAATYDRKARLTSTTMTALVLIALVGTALRMNSLSRNFYYDELFSAYHFFDTQTLWQTVSTNVVFNNHILYSILAHTAIQLFGRSEWVVRLPSLIMGIGGIFAVCNVARRYFSDQTALLASAALSLSPAHVYWSSSARGYTGLLLFTLLSSNYFLQLLRQPTRKDTFLFILSSVVAVYFHLYAALVTIAQVIFLFFAVWSHREISKRSFRTLYLSFPLIAAASLLLYAPVSGQFIRTLGAQAQSTFSPQFPLLLLHELSGGTGALTALFLFTLLTTGTIAYYAKCRLFISYSLFILLVPLAIMWLFLRPQALYPRFFGYFLPFFLIIAAAGFIYLLHRLSRYKRDSKLIQLIVLIPVIVMALVWAYHSWARIPEETDFREVIASMEEQPASLCAFGEDAEIFQYYTVRPMMLPASVAELAQFLATHERAVCAYHEARWSRPEYREMATFLSDNAEKDSYKKISVFTYRSDN